MPEMKIIVVDKESPQPHFTENELSGMLNKNIASELLKAVVIQGGMSSGSPSIKFLIQTPSGKLTWVETSAKIIVGLVSILNGAQARWGEEITTSSNGPTQEEKLIGVSFTLKDGKWEMIKQVLLMLKQQFPNMILVHGFLPFEEVVRKGFSTEVVDFLNEHFPRQVAFWQQGKTMQEIRKAMADYLVVNKGSAIAIGSMIEGVLEEYNLYKEAGVDVSFVDLGANQNDITKAESQV